MALHHVVDPILLLRRLRERMRKGGVIVVVEWLRDDVERGGEGEKYEEAKMKKLEHGPKIWPGFSEKGIEDDFKAAGCEAIEVKVFSVDIEAPESMLGFDRIIIAKAIVA